MEFLILGLLMLSPMTGYELQQFIKNNLALICSHSAGSVQSALTKLVRERYVISNESMEGRRRKKTFSITPAGCAAFQRWVSQPMQAGKAKNMELSKLFFLGLAKPEEQVVAIREYIQQVQDAKCVLCAIRERFQELQKGKLPQGRDWSPVFRFQGYTIEYGIAAADFEIEWYSHLLCELEEPS